MDVQLYAYQKVRDEKMLILSLKTTDCKIRTIHILSMPILIK